MSLVGWWPLHTTSGKAADLSGKGNHGSVNSATRGCTGKGGLKSYNFNGSSDYVDLTFDFKLQDFTLSVWVKKKGSKYMIIGSGANESYPRKWSIRHDRFFFQPNQGSSADTYSITWDQIPRGEWKHIAVVREGDVVRAHIDGELVNSKSGWTTHILKDIDDGNYKSGYGTFIGKRKADRSDGYSYNDYWKGNITDFRMYDRALSSSEINQIYEMGGQISPPEDGVSKYKFEGDATDSWHSNDGTVNGATFVDGKFGQAASFDGSDDNISVSDDDNLDIFAQDFNGSVSCWLYLSSSSSGMIANKYDSSTGDGWQVKLNSSRQVVWYQRDSNNTVANQVTTNKSIPAGEWVHIACTKSSSTENSNKIFINGKNADVTVDATGTLSNMNVDNPLLIGEYDGGGDNLEGDIDDLRIYNRTLRSWEIKSIYRRYNDIAQPPGPNEGGVAYYPLNGSNATDMWGSNDGSVGSGVTPGVDGIRGSAFDFDGTDDGIVSFISEKDFPETFTISSWVNPDVIEDGTSDNDRQYIYYVSKNDRIILMNDSNGNWELEIFDDSAVEDYTIDTATATIANTWTHVVGSYDGSVMRLYVNGSLEASKNIGLNLDLANSERYMGEQPSGTIERHFDGTIDDVRVYNRALKPWEVHEIYQWGTGGRDMRRLTTNVRARGKTKIRIVDNFEDGDLNEYDSTNGATITTSVVYEGQYALKLEDSASFGTAEATSGLNTIPDWGDKIVGRVQWRDTDPITRFQLTDSSNNPIIGIEWDEGNGTISYKEDGSTAESINAEVYRGTREWTKFILELSENNDVLFKWFAPDGTELASISEFTRGDIGGIRMQCSESKRGYFDEIYVERNR